MALVRLGVPGVGVAIEPRDVAIALQRRLEANWQMFVIRGLLAFALASACIVRHLYGIQILTTSFALYVLADGLVLLIAAFWRAPPHGRNWLFAADALAGIVAGLAIFGRPMIPEFSLVIVIGLRIGVSGVVLLMSATRLEGHGAQRAMVAAGMVAVLLAAALFAAPHAGLAWRLTAYLLAFGTLMLEVARQMRATRG